MKTAPITHCPVCGEPIYEGDDVYELDTGEIVCRDVECLTEFIGAEKTTAERRDKECYLRYQSYSNVNVINSR